MASGVLSYIGEVIGLASGFLAHIGTWSSSVGGVGAGPVFLYFNTEDRTLSDKKQSTPELGPHSPSSLTEQHFKPPSERPPWEPVLSSVLDLNPCCTVRGLELEPHNVPGSWEPGLWCEHADVCSGSRGCLSPGLLSPSQSHWVLCQLSVPSLPSTLAAAHGVAPPLAWLFLSVSLGLGT